MPFEFRLPDIGEGVVEGEIVRWLVKEGERINEDQPMVEVMTDKATVEIPSPRAGVVQRILVGEGTTCKVGQVMLQIDEGGNGRPQPAAPSSQGEAVARRPVATGPVLVAGAAVATTSVASAERSSGRALATPATRKLARDLGVDLGQLRGSGAGGRVTAEDVRAASSAAIAAGAPKAAAAVVQEAPEAGFEDATTLVRRRPGVADERVPLRGLRKRIAENMALSKRTAAHFTYVEECDVTELVALRARAATRAAERDVKLTYLPFIVKAVVAGLKKFPICNASLDEPKQEIIYRKSYHIGIGTATRDGLIVPVVRDADRRSVFELAQEIDRLSKATREGRARREELSGSTFTITSLGALGGVLATPIINYPEVAILGVHKFSEQPRVRGGQIVIRWVGNLSVSFDHRVVDGYEGAMFLQEVVHYLQDPTLMFLEMV
jgi:pyruvate dehydrogenase E2 component (dihydrolipoamide acetyltransferase)